MTRHVPEHRGDDLGEAIRGLADTFEVAAAPEDQFVAVLERRLHGPGVGGVLGILALVLLAVVGAFIGARLLGPSPQVGGPAEMPPLQGIYVTREPDPDGGCFAVRFYETTRADGRVALSSWTGSDACAARTDNLVTVAGRADGVVLPAAPGVGAGAGIRLEAVEDAPLPLRELELVIDPRRADGDGQVLGFPSVDAASQRELGIIMEPVAELDVPYRP